MMNMIPKFLQGQSDNKENKRAEGEPGEGVRPKSAPVRKSMTFYRQKTMEKVGRIKPTPYPEFDKLCYNVFTILVGQVEDLRLYVNTYIRSWKIITYNTEKTAHAFEAFYLGDEIPTSCVMAPLVHKSIDCSAQCSREVDTLQEKALETVLVTIDKWLDKIVEERGKLRSREERRIEYERYLTKIEKMRESKAQAIQVMSEGKKKDAWSTKDDEKLTRNEEKLAQAHYDYSYEHDALMASLTDLWEKKFVILERLFVDFAKATTSFHDINLKTITPLYSEAANIQKKNLKEITL